MFENEKIKIMINGVENEVRISRIIASFSNVGGSVWSPMFEKWLRRIGISDDDIPDILSMARNGKAELESSAATFLAG